MMRAVLAGSILAAAGLAAGPEGTFALDRAASDDVKKAIEAAAGEVNFFVRPFARGRLTKANPIAQRVKIVYGQDAVSVQLDRTPPVRAPRDGRTVKWTRDDGAVFDLSARTEDGALHQKFQGTEGQRVNVYRVAPDERTLTMAVTITSPRLPKPLSYRLVYRRVK